MAREPEPEIPVLPKDHDSQDSTATHNSFPSAQDYPMPVVADQENGSGANQDYRKLLGGSQQKFAGESMFQNGWDVEKRNCVARTTHEVRQTVGYKFSWRFDTGAALNALWTFLKRVKK